MFVDMRLLDQEELDRASEKSNQVDQAQWILLNEGNE